MIAIGKTDVGRVRAVNQDNIFVSTQQVGCLPNLFIVADGMGGEQAGDVASSMAINSFCGYINSMEAGAEYLDSLISGVSAANDDIFNKSNSSDEFGGMGTTFIGAVIVDGMIYAAHVGDSRLYAVTEKRIEQLTNDHSYVMEMVRSGQITYEEAENHPRKNIITRAVGTAGTVNVDGIIRPIARDAVYLLCSDGLSNMLSAEEIAGIVRDRSLTVEQRVDKLILRANENGGKDNISAVIVSPWEGEEVQQ